MSQRPSPSNGSNFLLISSDSSDDDNPALNFLLNGIQSSRQSSSGEQGNSSRPVDPRLHGAVNGRKVANVAPTESPEELHYEQIVISDTSEDSSESGPDDRSQQRSRSNAGTAAGAVPGRNKDGCEKEGTGSLKRKNKKKASAGQPRKSNRPRMQSIKYRERPEKDETGGASSASSAVRKEPRRAGQGKVAPGPAKHAPSASSMLDAPTCAFCKKTFQKDAGKEGGGRLLGPIGTKMDVYVHEYCALFSPQVCLNREVSPESDPLCSQDLEERSIRAELRRSAGLRCSICNLSGASIGCFICSQKSYHFPCAQQAGLVEWHWWENHSERVVHCPPHRDPLCEVWWSGDIDFPEPGWFPCAVVDGPIEGHLTVLYSTPPWGEERLNMQAVRIRFPHNTPPGCTRWQAFADLFGEEGKFDADKISMENKLTDLLPYAAASRLGRRQAKRSRRGEESYKEILANENDTPKTLAKKFCVDVRELIELNIPAFPELAPSSKFRRNTLVRIPTALSMSASLGEDMAVREHFVEAGETPRAIARRLKIDVNILLDFNRSFYPKISSHFKLPPNSVLRIPVLASEDPCPPSSSATGSASAAGGRRGAAGKVASACSRECALLSILSRDCLFQIACKLGSDECTFRFLLSSKQVLKVLDEMPCMWKHIFTCTFGEEMEEHVDGGDKFKAVWKAPKMSDNLQNSKDSSARMSAQGEQEQEQEQEQEREMATPTNSEDNAMMIASTANLMQFVDSWFSDNSLFQLRFDKKTNFEAIMDEQGNIFDITVKHSSSSSTSTSTSTTSEAGMVFRNPMEWYRHCKKLIHQRQKGKKGINLKDLIYYKGRSLHDYEEMLQIHPIEDCVRMIAEESRNEQEGGEGEGAKPQPDQQQDVFSLSSLGAEEEKVTTDYKSVYKFYKEMTLWYISNPFQSEGRGGRERVQGRSCDRPARLKLQHSFEGTILSRDRREVRKSVSSDITCIAGLLNDVGFDRGKHLWLIRSRQTLAVTNEHVSFVVGIATEQSTPGRIFLGCELHGCGLGFAYQGNSGDIFATRRERKSYGVKFTAGDSVGILLDCDNKRLSFIVEGVPQGVAFDDLPEGSSFWPAVGLHAEGVAVSIEHQSATAFLRRRSEAMKELMVGRSIKKQFPDGVWRKGKIKEKLAEETYLIRFDGGRDLRVRCGAEDGFEVLTEETL